MSHIDFAKLKESVRITQVLDLLEIKHLTVHNEQLRGTCPLCMATNARGFVVTPAKGTWYCFSEKKGGDLIRLAALQWRIDDRSAALRIADQLGLFNGAGKADDNPAAPPKASEPPAKSSDFDPLAYQKTLDPDHAALVPLGVSADTIRAFGGGFCTKGLLRGMLALPVYDGEAITAFVGIAIAVPHELKLGKSCTDLFGTQLITKGADHLVRVVAHPLDVLKAFDNGVESVIAPLKPYTWDVLTTLAEFAKTRELTVEF